MNDEEKAAGKYNMPLNTHKTRDKTKAELLIALRMIVVDTTTKTISKTRIDSNVQLT